MKYMWDSNNLLFYPFALKNEYELSGDWPADGIEVDETVFAEFVQLPRAGKRLADVNGRPGWADAAPMQG